MTSRGLTDIAIRNLKPKAARYEKPDPGAHGLYVVVQSSGRKGFAVRYRFGGISKKLVLKAGISLSAARKEAAAALYEVEQGKDPSAAKKDAKARAKEKASKAAANTVQAVCDEYLQREGKKLRSHAQRKAALERLVYPTLGARQIDTIKRSEIVRLLDKIEDGRGPVMADATLAFIRKIMGWHAARDDDFRSPIIRGMARTKPKERARARTLSNDELRSVWTTASKAQGPFPALLRFLLLTAARRNEAARMTWSEIVGTDWILPASRNKAKQDLVRPLSKAAQAVLAGLPRFADCPFVFTTGGQHPVGGFSKAKRAFDEACGGANWTLHDLRRTARSLMSAAGVNDNHAEKCLGHVIGGVKGIYDRYKYQVEMLQAYEKLAALIASIVDPQDNVVPMVPLAR